ncbi:MAG: alpha amylase C-terminal domain-containing protein [Cytophagales bacterium]
MRKLSLVIDDPWLEPYNDEINARYERYNKQLSDIAEKHQSLSNFATEYKYLGINFDSNMQQWVYREWAPNAHSLFFIGDFNGWDRASHQMSRTDNGVWEIRLEKSMLSNGSRVKVHVVSNHGAYDRIPAYIKATYQDPQTYDFCGVVWESDFKWTSLDKNHIKDQLLIYECHIGMASEKEGITSYREFAEIIIPRAKRLGYNTLQLMAVQEHPYYGSYGYHVSNFFAPSSRFGTPDDLRFLIDEAHKAGLAVIMDIIHSHAVKNYAEGLNFFDGSEDQYFHAGGRGYHELWDSKLFNYGKDEVKRFLLSNVKYWLEEFQFDGFRFDGITSMMYFHHGNYMDFDHYDKYFSYGVDWDALTYLQLANKLIHDVQPKAVSIAEDMSGMPGLCRKTEDGGVGFDYRLGMGIPDYWIKILKERRDEDWDIHELWGVMTNRRWKEKTVSYAESHDQALVGDKTIAFWLMDQEMYWHMQKGDENLVIDRGMALHKMIRFFTFSLGGEAYLTFFGNEFGHPEWIDFPREGNGWSYKYARRQWSLEEADNLKYHWLSDFEKDMLAVGTQNNLLLSDQAQQLNMDAENKVIIFERNNLIFVFNFHPSNSIFDYRFRILQPGKYQIILNSDDKKYGGHGRIDNDYIYESFTNFGPEFLSLYITNRTCLVLKRLT